MKHFYVQIHFIVPETNLKKDKQSTSNVFDKLIFIYDFSEIKYLKKLIKTPMTKNLFTACMSFISLTSNCQIGET